MCVSSYLSNNKAYHCPTCMHACIRIRSHVTNQLYCSACHACPQFPHAYTYVPNCRTNCDDEPKWLMMMTRYIYLVAAMSSRPPPASGGALP